MKYFKESNQFRIVVNRTDLTSSKIGWVIKTRGELLRLNYNKNEEEERQCPLCNLHQVEDVCHFVAICPILAEHKRNWFGKSKLENVEFIDYMNGKKFHALAKYCKKAIIFRSEYI